MSLCEPNWFKPPQRGSWEAPREEHVTCSRMNTTTTTMLMAYMFISEIFKHVCKCTHTHTHTYTPTYLHTFTHQSTHTWKYLYVSANAHTHRCTQAYMHTCTHIPTYIHILHTKAHTWTYLHASANTNTHTHHINTYHIQCICTKALNLSHSSLNLSYSWRHFQC